MIKRRFDLNPYEALGCMVRINYDSNYMKFMEVEHLIDHYLKSIVQGNYLLWTRDNKPFAYATWVPSQEKTEVFHMAAPYGKVLYLCKDLKRYLNKYKKIYKVSFMRRDSRGNLKRNGYINTWDQKQEKVQGTQRDKQTPLS
jgi:hemolysin-activating ACP:hemolysin acyltransferase